MTAGDAIVLAGLFLGAVGSVTGFVAFVYLVADRRRRRLAEAAEQSVERGTLAMQELELALREISKMNQRLQNELAECLEAKRRLQACKDG